MSTEGVSKYKILDFLNQDSTGYIDARGYDCVKGDNLKKTGDIDAWDAQVFLLRNLTESGCLDIRNVTIYDLSELKKCFLFVANKMPILNLPNLLKSGRIYTITADIFSAPKAEIPENIYAFNAQELVVKSASKKVYCNKKTQIFGNCKNILRNDNWILIEEEAYIVENEKNGIYKISDENRKQTFGATLDKNGQWKFMTDLMIKINNDINRNNQI